jgi:leucyl aminopeptidase
MKLELVTALAAPAPAAWLVFPVWEDGTTDQEGEVDELLRGKLTQLRQSGDLTGKAGETLSLFPDPGLPFDRLLIIGLGKREQGDLPALYRQAVQAAKSVCGKHWPRVALALPAPTNSPPQGAACRAWISGFIQGTQSAACKQAERKRFEPDEVLIWKSSPTAEVREAVRLGQAQGRAVNLARDLVNAPPNELYPASFAERCQRLAGEFGFDCTILDEKQIAVEKMGCLLGVAQASSRPPRVVVLRFGQGERTLGLVGKGVTFDSGGLSLKPSEGMMDMKCDMAGAATVLAAFTAIAELRVPVKALGVLALVENMPGGNALKLGDVLTARSGNTVEILNTDAEGRLILADALDYARSLGASHLIDLATLTGACMVALGTEVAGLFGNDERWRTRVRAAIWDAGERAWELPLFADYKDLLKSHFADIKNIGGKYAGAITAAKFLEQFVGETPWCHLDIAGPAWAADESPSRDAGGTGCFVGSLIEIARRFGEA